MKKLICILAGAALLGACEQKTEVVAPAASSPAPDAAAMGQKPKREIKNSLSAATTPGVITESKTESVETTLSVAATPAVSTETKTESTESTTTTTAATPNP